MSRGDTTIDSLIAQQNWHAERILLRDILLDCGLQVTVKWGGLCYVAHGGNIAMFYGLRGYCGVGFFKGVLIADPDGVLHRQSENAQAMRLMQFTSVDQITAQEPELRAFVAAAIAIQKSGQKVEYKDKHDLQYPDELIDKLDAEPAFADAFDALTPGRKRGYNLYFCGAKQSATRAARIEKHVDRIMVGKGIHDCICGLSARMPRCDGSHKQLES